ncbi:dimethylaniline monooxygenase [Penicillium malachiteum]|uniref:Dimethylaniline monooxygenase n=1 Tax=Penicillium malachiteum TaxID=1324776 RepID=A0AAD6HNL3_9EURO|nr:dimethylaniline monooxygenase [Penicillium malachiteum]
MPQVPKRVAVIGAGPAGAIATDALAKEEALDLIRVFERQTAIGGTWIFEPERKSKIPSLEALQERNSDRPVQIPRDIPCFTPPSEDINSHTERFSDTGTHENLHSNLPPDIMCFSQEPIPPVVSEHSLSAYGPAAPFRHRDVMRKWILAIFERGGYEGLVELGTTVELAERLENEWILTLRKFIPEKNCNYWWSERFDSLVVATGHYYLPYIPTIPGIREYDARFPGSIWHSKHYSSLDSCENKRVVVVGGSISAFDALHDIRRVAKTPVISALRRPSPIYGPAAFSHPDIDNRSQISSFDAKTGRINFADGSSVDNVDIVLFATGYDFSLPFLPKIQEVHKRIPGLYAHVFKIDDPTLAFVGMVAGGFGIRVFEWQAVAAARVLSGHAKLPSRKEMEQWEDNRLKERGEGGPFWTLMPDFEKHFHLLKAIAGDPAPGTAGRLLPEFDPKWADTFWEFIRYRTEIWQRDAAKAEKRSQL